MGPPRGTSSRQPCRGPGAARRTSRPVPPLVGAGHGLRDIPVVVFRQERLCVIDHCVGNRHIRIQTQSDVVLPDELDGCVWGAILLLGGHGEYVRLNPVEF